jgi:hypothetical protein
MRCDGMNKHPPPKNKQEHVHRKHASERRGGDTKDPKMCALVIQKRCTESVRRKKNRYCDLKESTISSSSFS